MPPKKNLSRRFVDRCAAGMDTLSHGRLPVPGAPTVFAPPRYQVLGAPGCNHRPIRCDDDVGESLLFKKILHA